MHSPVTHGAPITDFISELEAIVADAMGEWKIPGLAIAVVQNGEVALRQGLRARDVEAGLPLTTDTHFMICSITKSFTSTGLALLVDERRLDWKKPVRDYIPEFRLHDAVATERITVRDLLCHHSGLPRHDWIHLPGDCSPAQMLAAMRHLEPSDDIRSAYQYQNLGYLVAGMVAERISGQSWSEFTRARLTDKLDMTVTFTAEDLAATADAAVPYSMDGDTRLRAKLYPIRTHRRRAASTPPSRASRTGCGFHLGRGRVRGPTPAVGGVDPGAADTTRACRSARIHRARRCALRPRLRHADLSRRARRGPRRWLDRLEHADDDAARPRRRCRRVHQSQRKPGGGDSSPIMSSTGSATREPVPWLDRHRERRRKSIAQLEVDREARRSMRRPNTRPSHDLADYAGDYEHPGYGRMSITHAGEELQWDLSRHVGAARASPLRYVRAARSARPTVA